MRSRTERDEGGLTVGRQVTKRIVSRGENRQGRGFVIVEIVGPQAQAP